jgi:hypothetical protein
MRNTGALAGVKVVGIGAEFGQADMGLDSAFQPMADQAFKGLNVGDSFGDGLGTGDSDPFDLAEMGSGSGLDAEGGGPGSAFGTLGADGNAVNQGNLLSSKDLAELQKKNVSASVKGPTFKEKQVRVQTSADFDMGGTGKLDKNLVKEYIRKQLGKIKYCYQKGLQKNPELEGKVTVSFIISPTGSVMKATVTKTTLNDKEVEGCIENGITTWRFPAPQGGGVVKVNYPFVLKKQ